jgi:hypothetical protein
VGVLKVGRERGALLVAPFLPSQGMTREGRTQTSKCGQRSYAIYSFCCNPSSMKL